VFDSLVEVIKSDPEYFEVMLSEALINDAESMVFNEILNLPYTEILAKHDISADYENELLSSIAVITEIIKADKDFKNIDRLTTETEITPDSTLSTLPFVDSMVNRTIYKSLPKIDSVIYLPLNTGFDFNFKDREILNHIQSFNNQLPNINKYEVYYTEFDCDNLQDLFLTSICSDFAGLTAGFIIFYDSITKYAHIITIKNSYYIDSAIDLNFLIDKNYKINLTETVMTDGDVEDGEAMKAENYSLMKHTIEINKNGNFISKELE